MDPTQDPRHPASHGNRIVESTDAADVSRKRASQAREVNDGGTPTTPTLPGPMASGMVKGAVIGAVVGALGLTPLAFADILDLALFAKLVVVWIAGAAAGGAMGAVFLAGARAEDANPENDEYVYVDGTSGRREGPGGIH